MLPYFPMPTNTESQLVVQLQRLIAAPPEKVWQHCAVGIKEWLGPLTFDPQPGGRWVMDVLMGEQRWVMYGNVVRFDAPREVSFTWCEVDTAKHTVPVYDTQVSIMLEPQSGGTLVTLRHTGFDHLPDAEQQFRNYKEGWESLNDLENLAKLVEGGA